MLIERKWKEYHQKNEALHKKIKKAELHKDKNLQNKHAKDLF
jgi:hypothetical protein